MKYYTVYQTTNLLTGKIYVGSHVTDNPDDSYLGSSPDLKRDIAALGSHKFSKEILFIANTSDEMFAKEGEIVDSEFILREDTYNKRPGGKGGWHYVHENNLSNPSLGGKCAAEVIKEKLLDPQYRDAFCKRKSANLKAAYKRGTFSGMKGKHHSEESKAAIGLKTKGNSSSTGYRWVHREDNELKVKESSLHHYLAEGYSRGRSQKMKSVLQKNNEAKASR